MSFEPAKEKLTIGSVDNSGLQVEAQYNPKELQVDKVIPWSKANQSNKTNDEGIHLEFGGAEGRTMTVEMMFDGYETNSSVAPKIKTLEDLASVITAAGEKEDERRPHRCTISWGKRGLPRFDCVIEHISTKYTMFSSEGVPLRATCTVKLKEANAVSAKKPAATGGAA
ncbi:MAG: hypothetical protein ACKV2T_18055 [Kofleriaceae bacterium]